MTMYYNYSLLKILMEVSVEIFFENQGVSGDYIRRKKEKTHMEGCFFFFFFFEKIKCNAKLNSNFIINSK